MATLERIVCSTSTEFTSAVTKLEKDTSDPNVLVFYLFLGEIVESTGLSWCPDCTRAEPVINGEFQSFMQQLTGAGGKQRIILVSCTVSRTELCSADFVLKTDPNVLLSCVPTLMTPVTGGASSSRLGDAECQSATQVRSFLAQWL